MLIFVSFQIFSYVTGVHRQPEHWSGQSLLPVNISRDCLWIILSTAGLFLAGYTFGSLLSIPHILTTYTGLSPMLVIYDRVCR
jgi:hypothetical protein